MGDAATESARRGATCLERVDQGKSKIVAIVGAAVGELGLGEGPDPFVGIEFRSVGREVFEVESRNPAAHLAHGGSAVQEQSVPDHDHGAAEMAEQVAQEGAHFPLPEVVMVPLVVQAEALTDRADGETRDHRDAIAAIPVVQQRGLAARRPGPDHGGRKHDPRFVYEDDVGPQPNGVFFTRGQAFRFQRAIAGSSRSRARRSGFWQLHPHCARSRPTWSG